MIRLRWWAAGFLSLLGDSAARSILIGGPLLADKERMLGADRAGNLGVRSNLAAAYQEAGCSAEAITLHERASGDQESYREPSNP